MKLPASKIVGAGCLASLILQNYGSSKLVNFNIKEGVLENDIILYLDFLNLKISLSEINELLDKVKEIYGKIFFDVEYGIRVLCTYKIENVGYTYQVVLPFDNKIEIIDDYKFEENGIKVHQVGKIKVYNISSVHIENELGLRIYFRVFNSEQELHDFENKLQELEKSDHRFIGQKLDLFSFYEDIIGSGLPLFHPHGTIIRNKLIEIIRKINDVLGFQEVFTPHLWKVDVVKISGHYEKYAENMFMFKVKNEEFTLKPMNCPGHILIYKFKERSYADLPIRYAEFATVYRNEIPGALRGLLRVRALTQDDHHIFARPDQIKTEILKLVYAILKLYELFGFKEVKVNLSTKPEKYIGSDELWEIAESSLKEILEEIKSRFNVEYNIKEKEGAFYGPKIDFDVKDNWGRWWQLGTVQLDFFQPMRFNAVYRDKDGSYKHPVIIHCAMLGSIERFMAILLESTKGLLPIWISPIQVAIIPVSEKYNQYALEIYEKLKESGIRCVIDTEARTVGYKIRKYEDLKVPLMLVIGEKEIKNNVLSVREKGKREVKEMKLEELINYIRERENEIDKIVKDIKKFVKDIEYLNK